MITTGPLIGSLRRITAELAGVQVITNQLAPALSSTRTALEDVRQSAHSTAEELEQATTRGQHSVDGLQQAATQASSSARSTQADAQSAESSVRSLSETVATTETETRGRFTTISAGAASTSSAVLTMSAQVIRTVVEAEQTVGEETRLIADYVHEVADRTAQELIELTRNLALGEAGIGDALALLEKKAGQFIVTLRELVKAILNGEKSLQDLVAFVKNAEDTLPSDSPLRILSEELLAAFNTGQF